MWGLFSNSCEVVSGGYSSLRCAGLLPRWLLLQGTGSRHRFWSTGSGAQVLGTGSGAQAQLLRLLENPPGPEIEPVPLHWQANS